MKKFNLGNCTPEEIKRVCSDTDKLKKIDSKGGIYGDFYTLNLLYGGIGNKEKYDLFEDYDDLYLVEDKIYFDDLLFERGDVFFMTKEEYVQMKGVYSGEEKKVSIFNFNKGSEENINLSEMIALVHSGKLMERIDIKYKRDPKLEENQTKKKWEKAFSK